MLYDEVLRYIESLSTEELDVMLKALGIDPEALNKRMLERMIQARDLGCDTPMLHEAIRQFQENKK
jgi:hypothetical protein